MAAFYSFRSARTKVATPSSLFGRGAAIRFARHIACRESRPRRRDAVHAVMQGAPVVTSLGGDLNPPVHRAHERIEFHRDAKSLSGIRLSARLPAQLADFE